MKKTFGIIAATLFLALGGFFLGGTPQAHADSLEPVVVNGYNADVKVDLSNPIPANSYSIQIGSTVDAGVTCLPISGMVKTFPVPLTTGSTLEYPNVSMALGQTYCVGLGINTGVTGGGVTYFTGAGSTFAAQTTTILNPTGASTTPGANGYGCTSNGTTSYCMLAPLPIPDQNGNIDATGKVDTTQGFGTYVNGIIKLVMGLIGVLAVLMIVVGGIEYMSTVSIGEKEGAKSRIMNAILGLLLALGSYVILSTINPNLVNITVTVPGANLNLDVDTFTPTSGGGTFTGGTSTPNVTQNITTYDQMLKTSSANYGVECTLVKAFMYAESGGNPNAQSGVGAEGLIQLMPATFTGLGYNVSMILDPATNIDAGAKYISQLETKACNGSTSNSVCNVSDNQYVIASYNAGPKANGLSTVCQKGQGVNTTAWQCTLNSGYAQTRNYVPKVLANYQKLISTPGWGC